MAHLAVYCGHNVADIGWTDDDGTVRLLVAGAVLEDGHILSDYPALLASDCPTIHMLTVRAAVPSPAPVTSTPIAWATAEAARQGRQDRLAGHDDAGGSAAEQQRQQAEQCAADRLLAEAIAQAEEEEYAAAAAALQEQYNDEMASTDGGRFSDDDEGDSDGQASSSGGDAAPTPSREHIDEIAELAEEISTAQAQTAWSGENLHSPP